ncbi:hypothetical protein Tco_1152621 [Tanacetum coccineum]
MAVKNLLPHVQVVIASSPDKNPSRKGVHVRVFVFSGTLSEGYLWKDHHGIGKTLCSVANSLGMDSTMSGCNGFSSAFHIRYFECRCLNIISRNMLPREISSGLMLPGAYVEPTKDEDTRWSRYKLLLIMVVIRHDGNIKFVCLGYGERYMYGVFKQSISKAGREGTKEDWLEVVWHIPSIGIPDCVGSDYIKFAPWCMCYDETESDLNEFSIYDDIGSWANVDDFQQESTRELDNYDVSSDSVIAVESVSGGGEMSVRNSSAVKMFENEAL